jgi:membrane associated rhomboid family serine protease
MFPSSNVVKKLFYANICVFIIGLFLQVLNFPFYETFALYPHEGFMPHQLITYQFLHGGFLHILCNMLGLISIGPYVEDYLGSKKFIIYYLICGVGSGLLHMLMVNSSVPLVGASGSLYGIVLMFAILYPNEKLALFFFLPFKAKYLVSIMFLVEIYCAFFVTGDGIGHFGHVGGGLVGIALILIDKYLPKKRKTKWT